MMKRALALSFLLCLMSPDISGMRAEGEPPDRLSIEVVDEKGSPIPTAEVRVDLPGTLVFAKWEKADAQGRFTLRFHPPDGSGVGDVKDVQVRADGFAPAFASVPRVSGRERIVLARGVALRGIVVDSAGAPRAGEKVTLQLPNPRGVWFSTSVQTDAQGRFELRVGAQKTPWQVACGDQTREIDVRDVKQPPAEITLKTDASRTGEKPKEVEAAPQPPANDREAAEGTRPAPDPLTLDRATIDLLRTALKADLAFVGTVVEVGKSPGFWSGYFASAQRVTFRVEEVLKATDAFRKIGKGKEISVHYFLLGSTYCAEGAELRADLFAEGRHHLVLAHSPAFGVVAGPGEKPVEVKVELVTDRCHLVPEDAKPGK